MYGNVDADFLWLRLMPAYLIKECNMTRSKADSWILYKKDDDGKLELVVSVHVDDIFVLGRPGTLKNIKERIKLKINIQNSGKAKKFLGVYYEWGHDAKGPCAKINM